MAVTGNKKLYEQQEQAAPYTGLQGVSQGTAQKVGQYQGGYQQSQRVTQAQQTLQNIQAAKPQGYNSKYGAQLDNIMNQLQNPQDFKFNFNDDELFKYYADLYTQKGRQASMDTMGQAAALTGGYGNSYAQQAGQQAYQQNLLSLYDRGMDLYDRAYQRNQDNLGNLRNNYSMMAQADESDYGRYRDTVADWQREEALAADRAAQAEQMDYGQYRDALEYWSGLAQIENADFRTEQQRQEAIRQYEQDFAESQRQFNEQLQLNRDRFNYDMKSDAQKYAYNICEQILANGQMPSAQQLAAAGISEPDARSMMAQMVPVEAGTGGGTGGRGGRTKSGDGDEDGDGTGKKNWIQRAFDYAKAKDSTLTESEKEANRKRAQEISAQTPAAKEAIAKAYTEYIKKYLK